MADRTVRFVLTGDSAGAVRAMSETAAASEATGTKIGDTIDKGTSKAGTALGKLATVGANFGLPFTSSLEKIGTKFDETSTKGQAFGTAISEVGKVALLGAAAGVVAFGGEAIKLGNELEDSQASLKAAVSASGESMTQWQGPISAAQAKLEALGFTNTDVNTALAKSVISTQDVGSSLGTLSVAVDLARAKGVDLSTATIAVDKAMQGNLKSLKQMGIDLPITATSALKLQQANDAVTVAQAKVNAIQAAGGTNTAQYQTAVDSLKVAEAKLAGQHAASGEILDALSKRLSGQASAAAETFGGKVGVLKTQAEDLGASIGTKLIPIVEGVVTVLSKNKGAVEAVAGAISVVLAGAIAVFVGTKVVDFVSGAGKMVSALGSVVTKITATALSIGVEDDAIIASNEAAAASFTAMLGPIGLATAAVAGLHALDKGGAGIGGTTISSDQSKYNQQIAGAGGNQAAIAKINATAEEFNKAASVLHKGAIVLSTGADKTNTAANSSQQAATRTTTAAAHTTTAANAGLVAAQSQQAAGAAGTAAAKASSAASTKAATAEETEAKKRTAAAAAEAKRRTELVVSDGKAGTAALNTQINLTTSTSLSALNTGLNKTHDAALRQLETKLTRDVHTPAMAKLVATLNATHKEALANWVAQQKAASASAALAAAGGTANIIGLQEQISEDTANMAGLTGDALAVAQDQLALDQKKLADATQAAALQAAVDSATTATAKANAQAASDNFNALATIQEAQLAATLSGATNQQTIDQNAAAAVPALGTGGIVHGTSAGTIVRVGESGVSEAVVPLTSSGGISPLTALQTAGGSSGSSGGDIYLQIDGQTFAKITADDMRTALLKRGRSLVNIGLS